MKLSTPVLSLIPLLALAGCAPGHRLALAAKGAPGGPLKSENRKLTGFDRVHIAGALDVQVFQGRIPIVILEAEKEVLPHLKTAVKGTTLHIITEGSFKSNSPMRARITLPNLKEITVDGASKLTSKATWPSSGFSIQTTGASKVDVLVDAQNTQVSGSGASNIQLRGKSERLNLVLDGATQFGGSKLSVNSANVKLSGASRARVKANQSISGDLDGVSTLIHSGKGRVDVETSGVSSVSAG